MRTLPTGFHCIPGSLRRIVSGRGLDAADRWPARRWNVEAPSTVGA